MPGEPRTLDEQHAEGEYFVSQFFGADHYREMIDEGRSAIAGVLAKE